jgi:RNA polymerase sigma-70 factor (ECF subfamily)
LSEGPASDCERFLRGVEPRLRAYLYYAGAGPDVEDLVQDTCLKAHRHWGELAGHPEPAAWMLLVARNALRNRRKRADLERRALEGRKPASPPVSPEDPLEGAERSAAIQEALAGLPEAHREAVVGKVWGGLTWSQIGRHLGVSEDTAARLFARGLRALRPKLGRFAS